MPVKKKTTEKKELTSPVKRGRKPKQSAKKTMPLDLTTNINKTKFLSTIRQIKSNYITRKNINIATLIVGLLILGFVGYRYLIIAWVDKTPVTRIQMYLELEKKYGQDVKEQLIIETLVENEAVRRGVSINQAEVDNSLKKLEDQYGGKDKLNQILQVQNMTPDELKKQLRFQVLIEKMFSKDVSVSDDEVKKYISDNKEQFPEFTDDESSESAKVKSDIADQLKRQKVSQSFSTWLKDNTKGPRVTRL